MTITRISAFLGIASSAFLGTSAVAAEGASEPQRITNSIWASLLSHCGGSYFYSGSVFDQGGMMRSMGAGQTPNLVEFQGAKFNSVPVPITDAEKLNGMQYHARITMQAHVFRVNGGGWEDGPDIQVRNTNDMVNQALQSIVGNAGGLGLGGVIAFDLFKAKGTWAIGRSGVDISGPLRSDTTYYDAQKLISARAAKYSCEQKKVVPPPLTAAEAEAKKKADAEAQREAGAEAQRQAAIERQRQQDAARSEAYVREQTQIRQDTQARMAAWTYAGPASGFRAALLANLDRRAKEFEVSAGDYREEVDAIMKIVATCTAIKRADYEALAVTGTMAQTRATLFHDCDGRDNPGWGTKISAPSKPRAIAISRSLSRADAGKPAAFKLSVRFHTIGPKDMEKHPVKAITDIEPTYAIIQAEIPLSS